ncbi:MAG: hypothetical protein ACE5FR_04330, partial [Rhodospirillales bacterium]
EPETGGGPEGQPGAPEPSEPETANANTGSVGQQAARPTGPGGGATNGGGAQSLTFDREQYFLGQTIKIQYPYVTKDVGYEHEVYGVKVKYFCEHSEKWGFGGFVGSGKGSAAYAPLACKDSVVGNFVDLGFQLWKQDLPSSTGKAIGPIKYFRLRNFVRLYPGAIRLSAGETYKYGDDVSISVDLPRKSDVFLSESTDLASAELSLHRLAQPIHGGRITDDRLVQTWKSLKAGEQIVVKTSRLGHAGLVLEPRIYELRLTVEFDKGHPSTAYSYRDVGYVIDRKRFAVVQEPWANSLEVRGKAPFEIGDKVTVALREPALMRSKSSGTYLKVGLFLLDDVSGRLVRLGHDEGIVNNARYENGTVKYDLGMLRSGTFQARLNLAPTSAYLLDTVSFKVSKKSGVQQRALLSIGGRSTFTVGTPIPVTVNAEYFMSKAKPEAIKEAAPRIGLFSGAFSGSIGGSGDPLRTWPVEIGKKRAWKIEGDLAPGSYRLSLQFKRQGQYFFMPGVDFMVVPRAVSSDPSNPRTFAVWEPIEVPIPEWLPSRTPPGALPGAPPGALPGAPPGAMPGAMRGAPPVALQVDLVGLGGFVPGCAYENGRTYDRQRVDGEFQLFTVPDSKGKTLRFLAPDDPGLYLLRVKHVSPFGGTVVISEEVLDIVSRPPPDDTITLSKSIFHPREAMDIKFDLGNGIYRDMEDEPLPPYRWYVFRQGHRAEGGAERFPQVMGYGANRDKKFSTNQATVSTKAPSSPGKFEVRLYSSEGFLARRAFSVAAPGQPAPPDWGPSGATPPSDFPAADYPFPKGGEYLDPGECAGPFELESPPEKMDLRFVRWQDGRYVPIAGALKFGDAFYLEGRLEAPATKDVYFAKVGPAEGDTEEVTLFPDEDDTKAVRSELLYFIWDSPEEEADGAAQ